MESDHAEGVLDGLRLPTLVLEVLDEACVVEEREPQGGQEGVRVAGVLERW